MRLFMIEFEKQWTREEAKTLSRKRKCCLEREWATVWCGTKVDDKPNWELSHCSSQLWDHSCLIGTGRETVIWTETRGGLLDSSQKAGEAGRGNSSSLPYFWPKPINCYLFADHHLDFHWITLSLPRQYAFLSLSPLLSTVLLLHLLY